MSVTFSISGVMVGRSKQTVIWDSGKVAGDSEAVVYLETEAHMRELEGAPTGPPCGPHTWTAKDTLADPLSFLFLVLDVFGQQGTGDNLEFTGQVPTVPDGDLSATVAG